MIKFCTIYYHNQSVTYPYMIPKDCKLRPARAHPLSSSSASLILSLSFSVSSKLIFSLGAYALLFCALLFFKIYSGSLTTKSTLGLSSYCIVFPDVRLKLGNAWSALSFYTLFDLNIHLPLSIRSPEWAFFQYLPRSVAIGQTWQQLDLFYR